MIDKRIEQILSKHWEEIKKKKNVIAFDGTLKPKIKDGKEYPYIQCFRIYVSRKISVEDFIFHRTRWFRLKRYLKKLFKKDYPATFKNDFIPALYEDIPTDIVEHGEMKALTKVVKIGESGCHYKCTACTTGGFAKSTKRGEEEYVLLIANNHCAARSNDANIGDPYLKPSPYDGGIMPRDTIGRLLRFVRLEFNCGYRNFFSKIFPFLRKDKTNRVDIAAVLIDPSVTIINEVISIGKVKGKRKGKIGELGEKTGRTTGHTRNGKLSSNDWYGNVNYGNNKLAFIGPCGLIEKEGFSAGGDSSSLIVWAKDKFLAGNLFAGSSSHTIFCHWDYVEEDLEVEYITED